MAIIKPGTYSVSQIFSLAKFDFQKEASATYLNGGPDARRVQVGKLSFDSLNDEIYIPVTADVVELSLDGKVVVTLTVKPNKAQLAERTHSFEVAADAEDNQLS